MNQPENTEKKQPDPKFKGNEFMELLKTGFWAVLIAVVIRSFLFEPFNIPSGSMKPTLQVGDYLFVSKYAYGYSRYSFPYGIIPMEGRTGDKLPKRGDVVVFKLPSNTSTDYIKRIIGLPGDTIKMINGRLFLNGQKIERIKQSKIQVLNEFGEQRSMTEYTEILPGGIKHRIFEESDNGPLDNTEEFTVPDGHYFVMGDNRDNSQDSRVSMMVGPIPLENMVGRAERIFFSTNGYASLLEFWRWPVSIRYNRLFDKIGPDRP